MEKTCPTHVSVVVPIYNMERYLAETITSILASDYENFDIILMDDGSKDESLHIARTFAEKDERIKVFSQANAGASAARNHAIRLAQGPYILPVDADNNITPGYIRAAAEYLDAHPEVKVVSCEVEYCGDKSGPMHFAPFSLPMLARKNMIDNCAMYRKSDWEACGGYAEHIKGREDWAFWISMFKNGKGGFHRLPMLGFYYRVHANSKRRATQSRKHKLIEELNELHPEFYEAQLGGPLHYHRSWSRFLNICHRCLHPRKWRIHPDAATAVVSDASPAVASDAVPADSLNKEKAEHLAFFVKSLPRQFKYNKGNVIYKGRNELRSFEIDGNNYVVKSFRKPNWVNRIIYGFLRKSKAERSYEYADKLLRLGILTPRPVAFYQERCGLCFDKSYYVCEASQKTIHFKDIDKLNAKQQEIFLKAVGALTARLHEAGIYHKDYSGGNILVSFTNESRCSEMETRISEEATCELELLDLNRMRFGKVSLEQACANFDRFHVSDDKLRIMAQAYAQARGLDTGICTEKILHYHHLSHSRK